MSSTDGGLRTLYRTHLPEFHWQAIESATTGLGIPDSNYCYKGAEGWIENKLTSGYVIGMRPMQVAWIERRARAGGRVFIAVRRKCDWGPRRGDKCDQLIILGPHMARGDKLLKDHEPMFGAIAYWNGGPARWDWDQVREILTKNKF